MHTTYNAHCSNPASTTPTTASTSQDCVRRLSPKRFVAAPRPAEQVIQLLRPQSSSPTTTTTNTCNTTTISDSCCSCHYNYNNDECTSPQATNCNDIISVSIRLKAARTRLCAQ